MTQQNMQSEPNGKKLYVVNFKTYHSSHKNYSRILADSEEEAVAQAEKMFWKDTRGWGVDKLELSFVRLQNES